MEACAFATEEEVAVGVAAGGGGEENSPPINTTGAIKTAAIFPITSPRKPIWFYCTALRKLKVRRFLVSLIAVV